MVGIAVLLGAAAAAATPVGACMVNLYQGYKRQIEGEARWHLCSAALSHSSTRARRHLLKRSSLPAVSLQDKIDAHHILMILAPMNLHGSKNRIYALVNHNCQHAFQIIEQVNVDLALVKFGPDDVCLERRLMDESLKKFMEHDLSPLFDLSALCYEVMSKPLSQPESTSNLGNHFVGVVSLVQIIQRMAARNWSRVVSSLA